MRRFKKWLLILSVIFLVMIGLGLLFTYLYADEIKQYGVQQVNELVNTEISVEEIEFSIFQKFPNASLAFKNVKAKEVVTGRTPGTLFAVKSLYLEFNILKILKGDYSLNGISLEDGEVNLRIDAQGRDNYHFWKKSDEETPAFVLELEKVSLKDIELTFRNDMKETVFQPLIKKASITGMFSAKEYDLDIDGVMFIRTWQSGKSVLFSDRNVFVNVSLSVDQEKSYYEVKKGAFSVEDLHFFLAGDITMGEEANLANFNFTGNKLSIASLISLVPEKYRSELDKYHSNGEIKLNGTIRGWMSAVKNPEINIDFEIKEGSIDHKSSGIVLNNIHLIGKFGNGSAKNMSTSVLTIDSIRANFGNGFISGRYQISNFDNPLLDMTARGSDLKLEEIITFFPADSIETLSGLLDLDLRMRGYTQDLSKMTVDDFRKAKTLGKASIRNGTFAFKKSRYRIESLNGTLVFNNNDVKVDQLSARIFENDFEINGFFKNLLPYLFAENELLFLQANLHSNKLNWDDFMPPNQKESDDPFVFPEHIAFDLRAKVENFHFRNFNATAFRGEMSYYRKRFTVTEATFNSMKGSVSGAMEIDGKDPSRISFTVDGVATRVDIEEVFRSFDNFGQTLITDKNLRGICTANIQFSSIWNERWEVDENSIHTIAHLLIEKGELIDFKPVYSLSRFIKVEELNHIRFSSLENEIEIRDNKVFIPEMDIKSSALNLSLSGIHSFNNEIDYHFSLLLRDILSRKARKARKENEEFGGHVEDDGLGRTTLFLKMTGTVDDPKITYDRKGLRKKWEEDLKTEKATIRSILREEFGKKSAEEREMNQNNKEYDFEMEWEEGSQPAGNKENKTQKQEIEKDTVEEKKGLNKWFNKITKPNKQEYEKYEREELE